MAFAGTITLKPSTMIAAMLDWAQCLARHGFERIYWLNGHGGNITTINAAFSEIYHGISFDRAGANHPPLRCTLRNWWELPGVMDLCRQLFPVGEGSHATPSEVSVTYFGYPEAGKRVEMTPKIAPVGPIYDAEDYRRRFPDGRIGSDPSQATAEAGEKIVAAAVKAVIASSAASPRYELQARPFIRRSVDGVLVSTPLQARIWCGSRLVNARRPWRGYHRTSKRFCPASRRHICFSTCCTRRVAKVIQGDTKVPVWIMVL